MNKERAIAVALFVFAIGLTGFSLLWNVSPHDEGLMLQAAQRMADGQMPYRDFWINYTPGQPLLLAATIKLFGPSLLWWRIIHLLCAALVTVFAFYGTRRHASLKWSVLAAVAVAGMMAWPANPNPNAMALTLGFSALLLVRYSRMGAAAVAGVAIFFRPELGGAVMLGVALADWIDGERRAAAKGIAVSLLVAAVLLLPFVAVDFGAFLDQVPGFMAIQSMQRLPLPLEYSGPFDLNKIFEFYFPTIAIVILLLWAVWTFLRRPPSHHFLPIMTAIVGLLYLLGRTDEFHLVPLAVVLPVMLAVAATHEKNRVWKTLLVGSLIVIALGGLERRAGQALHPPTLSPIEVDVADGVEAGPINARAIENLTHYVRERVPPGKPIFVANPRHDLVRVGDPLIYVFTQRPNPTHYDVMQPGLITTHKVQQEIVNSLEKSQPKLVVRWLDPTAAFPEPNGAGRSSGVKTLDNYIAARYKPIKRFAYYQVMLRVYES